MSQVAGFEGDVVVYTVRELVVALLRRCSDYYPLQHGFASIQLFSAFLNLDRIAPIYYKPQRVHHLVNTINPLISLILNPSA